MQKLKDMVTPLLDSQIQSDIIKLNLQEGYKKVSASYEIRTAYMVTEDAVRLGKRISEKLSDSIIPIIEPDGEQTVISFDFDISVIPPEGEPPAIILIII